MRAGGPVVGRHDTLRGDSHRESVVVVGVTLAWGGLEERLLMANAA
jgi:hypothetical protein